MTSNNTFMEIHSFPTAAIWFHVVQREYSTICSDCACALYRELQSPRTCTSMPRILSDFTNNYINQRQLHCAIVENSYSQWVCYACKWIFLYLLKSRLWLFNSCDNSSSLEWSIDPDFWMELEVVKCHFAWSSFSIDNLISTLTSSASLPSLSWDDTCSASTIERRLEGGLSQLCLCSDQVTGDNLCSCYVPLPVVHPLLPLDAHKGHQQWRQHADQLVGLTPPLPLWHKEGWHWWCTSITMISQWLRVWWMSNPSRKAYAGWHLSVFPW